MDDGISYSRVRRAVRLIRECIELGEGEAARAHLAEGALSLVGGEVCAIVRDENFREGGRGPVAQATLAGFDAGTLKVFDVHQSVGRSVNPFLAAVLARETPDHIVTFQRSTMVSDTSWYRSDFMRDWAGPAGLDQFVFSHCSRQLAHSEGIALMRAKGAKDFTREDCRLVTLLHEGLPRVVRGGPREPHLAPRVRATRDLLIQGLADKEIAVRLQISPHTVRQYVKTILRAYRAPSRTALIASVMRAH